MTTDDARFPDSIPLNVSIKPEDGVIDVVGPYRHSVLWNGEDRSSAVTYCNQCGCSFTIQGTTHDGVEIYVCSECRSFQGFAK